MPSRSAATAASVRLPETRSFLFIYGQGQTVRYRSAIVLAKFLGGLSDRAVWVATEKDGVVQSPPAC